MNFGDHDSITLLNSKSITPKKAAKKLKSFFEQENTVTFVPHDVLELLKIIPTELKELEKRKLNLVFVPSISVKEEEKNDEEDNIKENLKKMKQKRKSETEQTEETETPKKKKKKIKQESNE